MTKIILNGCNGKMGQVISRLCEADNDVKIVAGFDINTEQKNDYPVFSSIMECNVDADVIIDFSNANAVDELLDFCEK